MEIKFVEVVDLETGIELFTQTATKSFFFDIPCSLKFRNEQLENALHVMEFSRTPNGAVLKA